MDIKEIEKRWSGYRTPNISYEDSANDIWFLLSHIKELEEEGKHKSEVFMSIISKWEKAEKQRKELETAIEKVLLWRNFDGDGISDPLRQELKELVEKK